MAQATKQNLAARHVGQMQPATVAADGDELALAKIRVDGGTQMRAGLNLETVADYADAMIEYGGWGTFEAVVVYHDGATYWLADGFHRVAAAKEAKLATVPAKIHAGDQRKAILHAAGANADHGLRRTNADKRRAVETLLRDSEWRNMTDVEIAKTCKVDSKTVGNIRRELTATLEIPMSNVRKGADGRTYDVSNIGRKEQAQAAPPSGTEEIVAGLMDFGINGELFKTMLNAATVEQIEAAMHRLDAEADPMRFLKLGNRRELLKAAQWVNEMTAPTATEYAPAVEDPRASITYATLINPTTASAMFKSWLDGATLNQIFAVFEDWPADRRGDDSDRAIQVRLSRLGVTELPDRGDAPTPDELEAMALIAAEVVEEDAARAERDAQRAPFERVPEVAPPAFDAWIAAMPDSFDLAACLRLLELGKRAATRVRELEPDLFSAVNGANYELTNLINRVTKKVKG